MATDEYPKTDSTRWIHEDVKFKNRGSTDDTILQDTDHFTWPAHLSTPAGKTLVITGRNEERKFTLEELLHRLDSFIETTLSRRRALINLVIIAISLEEVTAIFIDSDTNKIYKRLPKHPKPYFTMTLIGISQNIQLHQGGKAIIVFPQDPSTQADWHPEDATRIN